VKAVPASPQSLVVAPANERTPPWTRVRAAAGAFWLGAFFYVAERAPWFVAAVHRPVCAGVFRCSRVIRQGTRANAKRLLGAAPAHEVEALARRTLSTFFSFCCDVGRSFGMSAAQLLERVEVIDGRDHYLAARAANNGVIVVTAHMGSFEVGMAALRDVERGRIHVVFRRDRFERFEKQRSALRARLGVEEAPVDDGWAVWVRLRDALLADEAVVLQGDRVMPGQKGEAVPFLGGHLLLPAGPVKLALATGAPIVPIFSVRTATGTVRLFIEPAIEVVASPATGPHPALLRWAAVLEKYVRAYPDQWLMLQPALIEDADAGADAKDGRHERNHS
jgi:KDO2-lipid IV(A) lauroyltransferase